jgi:hypothetical protein
VIIGYRDNTEFQRIAYMRRISPYIIIYLLVLTIFHATQVCAQDDEPRLGDAVTIETTDGHRIVGTVVDRNAEIITVATSGGLRVVIPWIAVDHLRVIPDKVESLKFNRQDPNYSRLLFAPTGRPLKKGHGSFSVHYILLPGIAGGITNQFSLYGGLSLIPGLSPGEQVLYVAPKIGVQMNELLAVSVGTILINVSDITGGLMFGVVTVGGIEASITGGVALGYTKNENEDFKFADDVVVMYGGNVRLSDSTALISENYFITGNEISEQPFTIAIRFFGERITADFGFVLFGEVLSEGIPVPWLSMAYNWGQTR